MVNNHFALSSSARLLFVSSTGSAFATTSTYWSETVIGYSPDRTGQLATVAAIAEADSHQGKTSSSRGEEDRAQLSRPRLRRRRGARYIAPIQEHRKAFQIGTRLCLSPLKNWA
jgi:hypothetical protein